MFDFLKKGLDIKSPVKGKIIELREVKDPAFSQGLVGPGFAVVPEEGDFKAPIAGKIDMIFETGHAYVIEAKSGDKIMVHIGLDTVALKGEGFEIKTKQGQEVNQGDVIVKVDLEKVKAANYDITTPVIMPEKESDKVKIELKDDGAKFLC